MSPCLEHLGPATTADWSALEEAIGCFVDAWRQGPRPVIDDYLRTSGSLRQALLIELVHTELELRLKAGEAVRVEEHLARYPELVDDRAAVVELIAAEFELRRRGEPELTLGDYMRRFPSYRAEVREQVARASITINRVPSRRAERRPRAFPEIAGYEILGELGRGGMGVVYKARQIRLNRLVALKMILAGDHAGTEAAVRFLAEAEAVARLHHPHIVQIYAFGDQDGRPYFEMEYVPAGSLADRLDGTPWPAGDAARLVEVLARAIHEAHRLGIVHRDLKPANVLLASDGTPKVADFGLAKWLDVEAGLTQTDHVLGSPSYMAPEQAGGKATLVGPGADVYALGSILYELLVGRPPFRAATALETLEQVKSAEPMAPGRLQPGLPRDLETICLRCLRKEPVRRYAGADALAEDLRRFGAGEPILARPASGVERAWRWCCRKPALAALGTSVALLLLVVAIGAPLAVVSLSRQRDQARRAELGAVEKLWRSYLDRARASRLSGRAGQRFDSLEALARAAEIRPTPELRDEAIACLALTDLRIVRQWDGYPALNTGVDFDARLERYARSDGDGNGSVRRVADDWEIQCLPAPEPRSPAGHITFSPDGRFVAVAHIPADGRPPRHRVWDLSRGKLVLDLSADRPGARLAFSPDGRKMAAGRPDHVISIYDLGACREVKRLERVPDLVRIAFNPLGRLLAISGMVNRLVEVRDVDSGGIVARLPHPRRVCGLAWSGDGTTLAAGCDDRRIHLWDVATYRPRAILEGHDGPVVFVDFHPSGDLLVSASWDGTSRLWDPASGKQLVRARGRALRFSSDGARLSYFDAPRVGVWEIARGDVCRLLRPKWTPSPRPEDVEPGNVSVAFSPRGDLLASAGWDGVRLWDPRATREVAHLPLGPSGAALFHPRDGSLITYGAAGLQRRRIGLVPQGVTGILQVGPHQMLDRPCHSDSHHACLSRDGGLLAVGDVLNRQAVVLDVDRPADRARFGDLPGIHSVALSPDGRWIAAASRLGSEIKVWERASGRLLARLPDGAAGGANARVAFSPDDRWLVTGSQCEYRFWHVASWRLGRTIPRAHVEEMPGLIAFAQDGRLLAITPSPGRVQLLETATGRALADFSAPDPHEIRGLGFSPDDSQLAVATDDPAIQVWDLRQIRQHLAAMGLDGDLPPFAPSCIGEGRPVPVPLSVPPFFFPG
jgi:WD40 repeat protein/tRNA A-37 threonylcarbamoyl transferase component Bud32